MSQFCKRASVAAMQHSVPAEVIQARYVDWRIVDFHQGSSGEGRYVAHAFFALASAIPDGLNTFNPAISTVNERGRFLPVQSSVHAPHARRCPDVR